MNILFTNLSSGEPLASEKHLSEPEANPCASSSLSTQQNPAHPSSRPRLMRVVLTHHQEHFSLQQKIITGNLSQPKCRIAEFSPNEYIYNITPAPKAQGTLCLKDCKREAQGVCFETVSPTTVKSDTHTVSPVRLTCLNVS